MILERCNKQQNYDANRLNQRDKSDRFDVLFAFEIIQISRPSFFSWSTEQSLELGRISHFQPCNIPIDAKNTSGWKRRLGHSDKVRRWMFASNDQFENLDQR